MKILLSGILTALTGSLTLAMPAPERPEPQAPAEVILSLPPYCTWRTRFALDGVEIDREQLDPSRMKLVEMHVEGRRIRWLIFETIPNGEQK